MRLQALQLLNSTLTPRFETSLLPPFLPNASKTALYRSHSKSDLWTYLKTQTLKRRIFCKASANILEEIFSLITWKISCRIWTLIQYATVSVRMLLSSPRFNSRGEQIYIYIYFSSLGAYEIYVYKLYLVEKLIWDNKLKKVCVRVIRRNEYVLITATGDDLVSHLLFGIQLVVI